LADVPQQVVTLNFKEEIFEIAEGVGIAIGEVDFIFIVGKDIVPRKSEERPILMAALTISIFIIFDIFAASMPAQIL
jgi:hypothetical protein